MGNKQYNGINVWLPQRTVSTPNTATLPQRVGVVVATLRRPLWSLHRILHAPDIQHPKMGELATWLKQFVGQIDPKLWAQEMVWASVTHNERVDAGSSIQFNRVLGTIGASNGVASAVAVASATLTKTKTDLSLGTITGGATTNEFTTIGLSRAAGTVQNYVAPTVINGTGSGDVVKSFAVTGTGTAYGSGLFDQVVVAASNLYVEDNFATSAAVVSGDTLQVTWTITM